MISFFGAFSKNQIATYSSIPHVQQVFNRNVKRMQRNRVALSPDSKTVDYLKDEVAQRVVDRLLV